MVYTFVHHAHGSWPWPCWVSVNQECIVADDSNRTYSDLDDQAATIEHVEDTWANVPEAEVQEVQSWIYSVLLHDSEKKYTPKEVFVIGE
jgi:hypothetical protein